MTDQNSRVLARMVPERSMRAAPTLLHDMTVILDEAIAAFIAADDDGSALREAGFTAIADAIERRGPI